VASETRLVSVGHVVARLAKHLESVLGQLELSISQYRLLSRLQSGPTGASGLAYTLSISRPSVTSLVDGLVTRGLIERHEVEHDRRRIAVTITPSGRELLKAADRLVEARLREILSHATGEDAAVALRGLAAWSESLELDGQSRRGSK
jgi:long-chain acyl-CoA synthetase